jgi:coenzyme F420-reducing hydrogenase beta subunit
MYICDKNMCTGCSTCSLKCPSNAISMKWDIEGFLRPFIDEELCIHCNYCKRICPSNNRITKNLESEIAAYAYIHGNVTVRRRSSSGGAFMALAEYFVSNNGVVFGAVFDKNYNVRIIKAESLQGIFPMMGSKYVESIVGDSYIEVENIIDQGRMVLFSGLPCQIAGLYSYLGKKRNSSLLYTVDLLCHGVPSAKLFASYIAYLEKQMGKIHDYSFRDKSKWGWGSWGYFKYKVKNKIKVKRIQPATDYYYGLYFKENCFRESCYICKYATLPRVGDITIGDYWGIESSMPYKDIRDGVSLVIVNNEHAKRLLGILKVCDDSKRADISSICKLNKTIIEPAHRPSSRDTFYQGFEELSFIENAKKYVKTRTIIPVIFRYVPKAIKIRLRKVLKQGE